MVFCVLALYSCKTRKQLPVARKADTVAIKPVPVTVTNYDSIRLAQINAIKLKQVDFNTFSGKAAAKLNIDGKEDAVTMIVRIKKDKEIWISVTAVLGLEIGRAVITPDSLKVMNRLESSYLKKPFSYIYQYSSEQVNYKMLESLLIGNAIPEILANSTDLQASNADMVLNGKLQELVYRLIVGPDLRVSKTTMTNEAAGQSIDVANAQFIQSGARVIPSQVTLSTATKSGSIKVDMHYTKTEFDGAVEFPFTIPARFTPIN